jgi:repressor LexA
MKMYEKIGKKIREAREAKGMSQEELGRALGYTATAVSYFESGVRKIKLEDLQKISNILNVDMDYLVPKFVNESSPIEQIKLRASKSLPPEAQKTIHNFLDYAKKIKGEKKND